jgi:hypothetical protein
MEANEIREGWILCLAPDVDIQEIQVGGELRDPETYLPFATRTIWSYPVRLQMGDWYYMEDMDVVGWNEPADSPKVVGMRPNSPRSDDPPGDAERVYLGPVWVSVATGFKSEHTINPARADDGVTEERQVRISLQMHFPGVEGLLEEWDQIAFKNPIDVTLYADETLEVEIEEVKGVNLRARGHWLLIESRDAEIEQDMQTIWASLDHSPRTPDAIGLSLRTYRIPAWRLDLYEVRSETTSTDEICQAVECVEISKNTFTTAGNVFTSPKTYDGQLQLTPMGEFRNGIKVKDAWFYSGDILYHRHGPLLVFTDPGFEYGDKWLFIEVESYSGFSERMGINWDIFYEYEDGFISEIVAPAILHEDRNGIPVITRNILTQLRRSPDGMILLGAVPGDWTMDRIILVHRDGGPAWRLE